MMRGPLSGGGGIRGVLALTGGDIALIVLAVAFAAAVFFLALVMVALFRVLTQTESLVKGITEQTVPLLGDVRVTVQNVNRELDRADTLLEAAGRMSKSAERITTAVEHAVTSPLVKFAAFGAGASAALKRLRGDKDK
jgi:uncharacterized protein YoxC